jgi:hypothetical protein
MLKSSADSELGFGKSGSFSSESAKAKRRIEMREWQSQTHVKCHRRYPVVILRKCQQEVERRQKALDFDD